MDRLRAAFERCAKALSRLVPGRSMDISRTRLRHGLTCEVEEGPWRITVDMPVTAGGSGVAPSPGVYGRAALGSCLAVGYMLHAKRLGVPIDGIDIEVRADYDDAAMLGVNDAPPDYLEVHYTVIVDSIASEQDVQRVLDEGDAHSPYVHVFTRAQARRRSVRIVAGRTNVQ